MFTFLPLIILLIPSLHAFTPFNLHERFLLFHQQITNKRKSSSTSLHMHPNQKRRPPTPRTIFTPTEEENLLRQAIEYRRIKKIESELVLQSPRLTSPSLSHLAQSSGYSDIDLELFEVTITSGQNARDTLISAHMPLVQSVVNTIIRTHKLNSSLTKDDLIQEGCIGLARAMDKFQFSKNTKFTTYAVYWIRAAVLRCIAERNDIIRVPEHVSYTISKVRNAAYELGLDLDVLQDGLNLYSEKVKWREAEDAKKLALEAELTENQFNEAMKVRHRRNQGVVEFQNWMVEEKTVQEDKYNDVVNLKEILEPFLKPKEMEALSLRYGLDHERVTKKSQPFRDYLAEAEDELFGKNGILNQHSQSSSESATKMPQPGKRGEAMSFKEVGKQMAISAEYGRRLCYVALEKLRRAIEDGKLDPALLTE